MICSEVCKRRNHKINTCKIRVHVYKVPILYSSIASLLVFCCRLTEFCYLLCYSSSYMNRIIVSVRRRFVI